jgi:ubiquitin-conjugating enzyme E2 R
LISIFLFIFRKQVQDTKKDAERDGVTVPTTLQEYCVSVKPKPLDDVDFYDDDDYVADDDDDDDDDDYYQDDDDDSGNGGES